MKQQKKQNIPWMLLINLGVVLVLLINLVFLYQINNPSSSEKDIDLELMMLMTKDCTDCFDLTPLAEYLKGNGITDDQVDFVEYDSEIGQEYIEKYQIDKVPTAVITGDIEDYAFMQELLNSVGEIREEAFVLTKLQPPYLDLPSQQKRGDFEIVYLTDDSCEDCYDVSLHEEVFSRLVMTPSKVSALDVSEDEAVTLIEEYGIIQVPTFIMRGDLDVYEHLATIWPNVGNIEEDGTYVLRKGVESMGIYKDLLTGEVITPEINE